VARTVVELQLLVGLAAALADQLPELLGQGGQVALDLPQRLQRVANHLQRVDERLGAGRRVLL